MRKLISLSLLFSAFILMSPSAMAQNDHQKEMWKKAEQQAEKVTENIDLNDNDKAYITRHLYNYQARLEALSQNPENISFNSKSEVYDQFNAEMKTVLGEDRFNQMKELVDKVIEKDSK